MPEHQWEEIRFSFDSYIQCSCGFCPHSQEEMDNHK